MLQCYSHKKIFRLYHSKMNHRDERKPSRYHSISCCYMHSLALSCLSRVTVGVRHDLLYGSAGSFKVSSLYSSCRLASTGGFLREVLTVTIPFHSLFQMSLVILTQKSAFVYD